MGKKLTEREAAFDEIDMELARVESRLEQLEPNNHLESARIYRAKRSVIQARIDMRRFLPTWRQQETSQ